MKLNIRTKRGFSLVEVTMALAMMAFVFVSLMGMLSINLRTYNQSIDLTTETNIAQRLYTMAQQTPYDPNEYQRIPTDFYFDIEGFETSASDFVYHARLQIDLSANPITSVPAVGGASPNPLLRKVNIQISRNFLVDEAPAEAISTFSYMLADTGL